MFDLGTKSKAKPAGKASSYDRHKERTRARQATLSKSGRDLGELPAVKDAERREGCRLDFKRFCNSYAPHVFKLEWSEAHHQAAQRIETVVIEGGLFALAMPRGWGKTSLCQWGVLWAVLYGHRLFAVYIGATGDDAKLRLEELKTELETNELLAADFPEVCHPIRQLDGITQRGRGQTYRGKRTYIGWKGRRIILPTIPGSAASGAIIEARGLTGSIRGMRHTTPDGRIVRPDLAVPDDPQDDESAASPREIEKRLRTISGSVLRLPGPGQRIAAFLPCTVIRRGDVADQLLDRKLHPRWRGQRTQALTALPANEKAWAEYAEARAKGQRAEDGGKAANAWYKKHQAALEDGAEVVWPANVERGDLTALQSLMNLKIDDEMTFWAEMQQEPVADGPAADEKIEPDQLAGRIAAPKRNIVPQAAPRLVAFIDPNAKLLWWVVCAFGEGFTGQAIAYGTWPDQELPYWTNRDAKKTLARALPGAGRDAQVLHGLEQLTGELLDREWSNESGDPLRIERCLVDANWGEITTLVYQFCRQSPHATTLMPSHGHYVGPGSMPIEAWPDKPGDRVGHHWRERSAKKHARRFVLFDANRWKTFVSERLRIARGDSGALTIHQAPRERHRMLFDHLVAESPTPTESRGKRLVIWKQRPGRDNDLFDCLVGCHVGASMLGVAAVGQVAAPQKKKRHRRRVEVNF